MSTLCSSKGGDIVTVAVTFGPGLDYLAHHPVPVLIDADDLEHEGVLYCTVLHCTILYCSVLYCTDLELVGGACAEVVDLDLARVGRVDRQLDPVGHPGVLFSVPATMALYYLNSSLAVLYMAYSTFDTFFLCHYIQLVYPYPTPKPAQEMDTLLYVSFFLSFDKCN